MAPSRLLRGALAALLLALVPGTVLAQSSVFGVRGLGHPGRPLTPASRATGGSFGLFDGESNLNPAALAGVRAVSANFVLAPTWRRWESPAGDADLRETRFPLVAVAGPVPGTRVGLGIAFGSYADRDFRLATVDTITVRGLPVGVTDTLTSLGGLHEIRFAGAIALGSKTMLGGGVYWITGSSRMEARRTFGDTTFLPVRQSAELSYQGVGLAVGVVHELRRDLRVAGFLRSDSKVDVDRDSTAVETIDLPYTVGAGLQYKPSRRLTFAASGLYRTWSGANSDLRARGGPGAENTLELSVGGELVRNLRHPGKLPVRFGARYAELPFPIEPGAQPHEVSVTLGTGTRFAQDRAGFDLSLEQTWRRADGGYRERAFSLIVGLSVRPYGGR